MIKKILAAVFAGGAGYGLGDLAAKGEWRPLAIIAGLMIFDKILSKNKVAEKAEAWGEGLGVALSVLLRSRMGLRVENQIELRIIEIKSILDGMLGGFIIGLRKDNIDQSDAIEMKQKQKEVNDNLKWDIKHLRDR